jgi:hypothetical protein
MVIHPKGILEVDRLLVGHLETVALLLLLLVNGELLSFLEHGAEATIADGLGFLFG